MEIINKSDEKLLAEYEQFASTSKYGNFMQSLKWPKVKDNWGWDAVISRDADGNIRGTCLIIIKKVPIFGVTFMYAPHGPVCDWSDKEVMTDLFEGVKEIQMLPVYVGSLFRGGRRQVYKAYRGHGLQAHTQSG